MGAIELKDEEDGGLYLVTPAMTAELGEEVKSFTLRPYVNRSGVSGCGLFDFRGRTGALTSGIVPLACGRHRHAQMGEGHGEPEPWGLRGLRGGKAAPRPRMAGPRPSRR